MINLNILRYINDNILIILPDVLYTKIRYFLKFRKILNINQPKTFNEKMHFLKFKNFNIYSDLADKFKVRDYIQNKIDSSVLAKIYWVGTNPNSVPFDQLPSAFVIKCNHWSWYNIIIRDKLNVDKNKIIELLKKRMKEDYWRRHRELQYKYIEKKIIIEELLVDKNFIVPIEYKVFCFNWLPEFVLLDYTNNDNIKKRCAYDVNWNKLNFQIRYEYDDSQEINLWYNHNNIFDYAKKLSVWFSLVRVDFYICNNQIYVGEMTFTSWAWFSNFLPNHEEIDNMLWKKITL